MEQYGRDDCQRHLLSCCVPGDVLRGVVSAVDGRCVYIDVNGATAVIPRRRIAISPMCGPDRFQTGDAVYGAVHRVDREKRRIELTHRELLGTFAETVEGIAKGDIRPGICCGERRVELAPNLVAFVREDTGPRGAAVDVRITGVDYARCRIYAEIVDMPKAAEPPSFIYYITKGRIKHWSYTEGCKNIARAETRFSR